MVMEQDDLLALFNQPLLHVHVPLLLQPITPLTPPLSLKEYVSCSSMRSPVSFYNTKRTE